MIAKSQPAPVNGTFSMTSRYRTLPKMKRWAFLKNGRYNTPLLTLYKIYLVLNSISRCHVYCISKERISSPNLISLVCLKRWIVRSWVRATRWLRTTSSLPLSLARWILIVDLLGCRYLDRTSLKHEVLRFDELPKPGTIISIDAEFVALQQVRVRSTNPYELPTDLTDALIWKEESEFRSDGTKKILKPSQLSLARVSVLRGDGPKEGVPFIDDYIYTSDTIVDYLTEYSGIRRKLLISLPIIMS